MPNDLRPATTVARGATYLFFQGVLSTAIGVVFFMVLTRFSSPEEMGVYNLLYLVTVIVNTVGTLALPAASTKYIAQYLGENNREKARSVVARVLQISSIPSVISLALILVMAGKLSATLPNGGSAWTPLFQILAFVSFLTVLLPQTNGFLQGLQRFRELAAVQLAFSATQHLLAIYLLHRGWGLRGVVYGWLAGIVISFSMSIILTAKFLGVFEKPHPLKPLINFSYPLYISGLLGLVLSLVDQFLLLPYKGLPSFGEYSIALRAYAIPGMVSASIGTALFPQLSKMHAREGKDVLKQAFLLSTRTVLVGFPIIVGLAASAYPVIALFAGERHLAAAEPLPILCLALLPGALGTAISPTLLTLERTKTVLGITVVSILSETVICYLTLAPPLQLGVVGAAWSRVFASFVGLTLGVFALRRSLQVSFDVEALWKASVASALMAVVVLFLRRLTPEGLGPFYVLSGRLAMYVVAGGAVYFLSLLALRAIKKRDMDLLRDYLPQKLRQTFAWLDRLAVE